MLGGIVALCRRVATAYHTRCLTQKCATAGPALTVKGPTRVRGPGSLRIGAGCIVDATRQGPVCLDIGLGATLSIGAGTYVNEGVRIVCNVGVTIGARCLIAPEVVILDDDGHPVDWRERHNHWPTTPETRIGAPIVIEDNVWLCQRAMVLKGVRIGAGSVVAAGAVVTHSVPPGVLVAGVPAEIVREL